jgi:ABC-type glycerol-3-phosphate transport system substrate-binding protein
MNEDLLRQHVSRRQALKLLGSAGAAAAAGAALPSVARAAAPAVISRVPDVELTWFMWTGSPAEVAAWEHDITFVTQKYPNIHIKFVTAAWPDYWTKLPTEAAGDTLQDIISLQSLRTGLFAPSFQPLTPYIKQSHFDVSAFDSSIIGGLTYNGSLRALPYDFGPEIIYYNIDMFKAANVPLPRIGWTWDEFVSTAKKLTSGNKYGFIANPYPDAWLPFALSDGARYLDSSGKLAFTNSGLVAAFQKQIDLVQKDKVAPALPATKDTSYTTEQWQAGNVAMVVDGPWDLINDKAVAKFKFGIVPIPKGTKGSVTFTAGSGFGISTTTKHSAEAWKAITMLTGPQAEQYLASAGRAFAARKAYQQYWYKNAVPGAQTALQAALASAVPYKITPQWSNISFSLFKYGISAFNGQMSAKDALQAVQTQFGG